MRCGWMPGEEGGTQGVKGLSTLDLVTLVEQLEVALARAADRTEPIVGDVGELRARGDAAIGIPFGRVVDEPAGDADVTLACHAADDSRVRPVEVDRPGPGEELNTGAVAVPRVASSVIVLRDSDAGPEVLLVQRNPAARFMGGAGFFPGGAVHGDDYSPAATGVRELDEEAGLAIDDPAALV